MATTVVALLSSPLATVEGYGWFSGIANVQRLGQGIGLEQTYANHKEDCQRILD